MKKIKLIFLSVVTIAGVGGALATGHKTLKPGAVTYYAIRQGTNNANFTWQTTHAGTFCSEGSSFNACTVISADGSAPDNNSVPSGSNWTVTNNGSLYY
jgi:hypothetical protein